MRDWFAQISLRWKLALVTVVATAIALSISGVLMALYDVRPYESQKVGALTSEARVLAGSMGAALTFNDTDAALEYLAALDANPEVVAAAAYDSDRQLVTSYVRPGGEQWTVPATVDGPDYKFEGAELGVFVRVFEGKDQTQKPLGWVYVKARVEPVEERLARYALILMLIGAAALALALPVSLWLHRLISSPIEELAERNDIIRTMLNAVDHGLMVVDKDMRVTYINNKIGKLFPDSRVVAEGDDIRPRLKESSSTYDKDGSADNTDAETAPHMRGHYHLSDGRTVEFRHEALPHGGFVRTYTDISEERLLQERLHQAKVKAEDAAVAKSQFLAAMSHEIRTPMSGVIGIVELLRSTQLSDEQRQMVELIQRSGVGLLDVINDILDYSKIEAGRMTVEKIDCSLAEIVETTAEVIGGHTLSKTLNITCVVDPRIDAVVKGDPVRIRQVIMNLMGNAVKFTETGTASIEASIESVSEERLAVLFEVADTGMGIPEDKQKQLFQAFSQADYSATRKYGGTGLGLSISKNLVELMGGEIGVRSVPGKGSTFWFRIPFPRLSADQRHDPLGEYAGSLTGLRMVVYDPLVPHSAPARYLRAAGAEVITPASHSEVIARLHSETGVGRSVDAAVVCLRIGDSYAARLIDDIRRIAPDVKIIVVAPHLSGSAAKVVTAHKTIASIPAPIRRTRFYATVASATGRATQLQVNAAGGGSWNFEAPTTHEALAHGCLILVAEDNQTNQFVIKSQMRKLGFAAEFVNDGKEAWDTLNRHAKRYGLLITDCHMPFIDGYQLTGFIRDHEMKFGGHLPVVALTANALQGEADVCRAAGMDGYLFKPTDLATLETTILKWLPQAASLRRPLDAPPAQLAVGPRKTAPSRRPPSIPRYSRGFSAAAIRRRCVKCCLSISRPNLRRRRPSVLSWKPRTVLAWPKPHMPQRGPPPRPGPCASWNCAGISNAMPPRMTGRT
jgi:signal transduction histidine kinase/CheY-like chemotaxis protein